MRKKKSRQEREMVEAPLQLCVAAELCVSVRGVGLNSRQLFPTSLGWLVLWNSELIQAYGALCWNLAKLIPFKDMPCIPMLKVPPFLMRLVDIYTTFIPGKIEQSLSRKWSLEEFAKIRVEVIQKIHDAPSHHVCVPMKKLFDLYFFFVRLFCVFHTVGTERSFVSLAHCSSASNLQLFKNFDIWRKISLPVVG